jgi:hypothetical protein
MIWNPQNSIARARIFCLLGTPQWAGDHDTQCAFLLGDSRDGVLGDSSSAMDEYDLIRIEK